MSSSSSSSAISPSASAATNVDASQTISGKQIASWSVGNRQVAVFETSDNLNYSITEGSQVESGNISLTLYDSPPFRKWAPSLIAIFKQVLLSEGVKPSFLPIYFRFYEKPSSASKLILALFAQFRRTDWGKEVVQAKWGVRELANSADPVQWLEVTDRETKDFLTGAPSYEKELLDYCEHYKEVVTLDVDNRVQAIAMRCISALDRDVYLNENTWAVTLISAQKRAGWGGFFSLGHGSVAWEGVEAGSYFLKWADITTAYENRQPGEARIRIETRTIPSTNWMPGPTCSRSKDLVQQMVDYISRDIFVSEGSTWSSTVSFKFLAPFTNMFKSATEIETERRRLASLENCLSFAISALKRANIFLPEPGRAESNIEPHLYVMSVRSNYVADCDDDSSRIVFRNKNAKHSANRDVEDQIWAHFYNDAQDLLKDFNRSIVLTQDGANAPHPLRPTNTSNDNDDE